MSETNLVGEYLSGTASDQPVHPDELEHRNVLVLLAQGFEDVEAACALDMLGWTNYRPSIASVSVKVCGFRDKVQGAFGTTITVDEHVARVDASSIDALVIPGGFHNKGFDEIYDPAVFELVRSVRDRGKPIATMCVGVLAVAQAGVLAGGKATTYPLSSRHDNPARLREFGCEALEEPLVDWNGIISCSGPAYSEQVMSLLLEKLIGAQAAREVKRYRAGYPLEG